MNYSTAQLDAITAVAKAFDSWGCPELLDKTTFEWSNRFKSRAADGSLK